ncbi:MAG: hypothetical protein HC929_18165, partial [Leptolyngbyaceae cyanobacterium SM2_5_2]|nr:hypothetical protein [Leptolyngbyaceae cyanobacterium SM2_5_2]
MAQIFISAGHGGFEDGVPDLGSVLPTTTEAAEMIRIRDLVVAELRSRNFAVLSVPDDLSAAQTLAWINARCRPQDIALEIHASALSDPGMRGSTVFYIAQNEVRRSHAEIMLLALRRRVPQLPSRGVRPDTESPTGRLLFTRSLSCPSLLMEIGSLSNPQDLAILQNQRRDVALGMADGLASWSRSVNSVTAPIAMASTSATASSTTRSGTFPEIRISINGGVYPETGIIVNDNSYVPIDVADLLGVDLSNATDVTRIRYANVVYVKAVDLRNYNVSVNWNADTRTILLRSPSGMQFCPGSMDRLMGFGSTSEMQLLMFLKSVNEGALNQYRDLPKLYREEAVIEGVFELPANLLLAGENVVAVEVHQPAAASSDIVFGLELKLREVLLGPYTPGAGNYTSMTLPEFPLVWINEVQPNNVSGALDNFGEREPWLELYNS